MKNQEIADALYEIADYLELQDVQYKPLAYRRAARSIEALSEDVADVHERGEIEGVGPKTAKKLYREPLELDLDAVVEATAPAGTANEIHAQPERLDLDWAAVKAYRDDVEYVISTDAHTAGELDFAHLGVAQARRGWCTAADVRNTRPLDEVASFFGD